MSVKMKEPLLKPLSVTNNSVSSRTAAASHMGHNSSAHAVRRSSLRTNDVRCNRNGLLVDLLKICSKAV